MIPKSLSASAILVSEGCLERYKHESFNRTPQASSEPANIGTACHYALEHFVDAVYLKQTHTWQDVKLLNTLYHLGYVETFNSTNTDTDAYRDGAQLIANWYDRHREGLPNKVISVEKKLSFPVKTSAGVIPFNYIYDRLDDLGDGVYEVVDYKSWREYTRHEDMKKKIQVRAYALAAQIMYPDATRIWVTLDLLRHDTTVGVAFSRDENADTYRYIKRAAERIIEVDEDDTPETLNSECKWCIKKATCETLGKAKVAGMVHGLDIEELAQRKLDIDSQILALKYAQEELDKAIVAEAEHRGEFEFDAGDNQVIISARKSRKPNSNAVINIIGADMASKWGNMTVTNIDKMIRSGELTPDQVKQVQAQITQSWSEPSAKIKPKGDF